MKITLDIRDDLLGRAKELAAIERTSLTEIIEEALALRVRAPRQSLTALPVSRRIGGLIKGIDGARNHSLLDAVGE